MNAHTPSQKRVTIIDRTFKNSDGEWALAAKPNLPIITWFVSLPLQWLLSGTPEKLVTVIGRGALFTWAWLELFQGVNYFRRALGGMVLLSIIWAGIS